ncbi:MAG: hypothetical protein AAFV95_19880 [Bacteroidota bacterium]
MSWNRFLLELTALTAGLLLLLFVMHQNIVQLQSDAILSWIATAAMANLCLLLFGIGRGAAMSDNKHSFTNVIVGSVLGKMGLCVMLVLTYSKLAEPTSKWFLLPFFLIYVVYTAYECYFMIRLGKMQTS